MPGNPATFSRHSSRSALAWLAALWLAARLPLWLAVPGAEFDMESYARVAGQLSTGGPLYGNAALEGRYPYFPAWGLLIWGLDAAARVFDARPELFFKLPSLLGDLGVTFLIYRIALRLAPPQAAMSGGAALPAWMGRPFWAALAWAANPLPLLCGAGHGQFDSVALCFVLLASWYLEFSEEPRSDFASALSLGFAIAFKTWPVFFLPLFVRSLSSARERRAYALTALLPPLLLILPFIMQGGGEGILNALSYTGSQAFSLPEALRGIFFGVGAAPESYRAAAGILRVAGLSALGASFLAYSLGPWRFPLFAGLAYGTLTLYVFAPGMAAQYLCWLLPFALLIPGRLALRHSLVSLPLLLIFYSYFAPGAMLRPGFFGQPPSWFFGAWALLNLGFWFFLLREWVQLGRLCRWPSGRMGLA